MVAETLGRRKSGANSGSSWVQGEESRVSDRLIRKENSLASWEVWPLLIDLDSPLASPGCLLFSSDFCSLKGEGHVHMHMHMCV